MGSYRSEDDALVSLARQLTDAYGEARRRVDQDYACDSIAEFLSEYRDTAPDEALLALLDLPLTAETYPLVDEAQTALARRGAEVVRRLLEAVRGNVYDPEGEAPERAAETLDMMDRRDSVRGLTDVLCSRAGDDVKGAAVDGLVALGGFAEPALAGVLGDPDGGDWAKAALEQIRYVRADPGLLEEYAAGEDEVPDDASELLGHAGQPADPQVAPEPAEETRPKGGTQPSPPRSGAPRQSEPAGPSASADPDKDVMDDAYEDFLRRFEEESGGETPA